MLRRALLLAIVVVSLGTLAAADQATDPDDSDSRLDVAVVRGRISDTEMATFLIRTHDGWNSRLLRDARPTTLKLLVDAQDNGTVDLVGNFRYRQRALWLFLRSPSTGDTYEPVKATRPRRRTVKARFPADINALNGQGHTFYVKSVSSDLQDCPDDVCRDRAPDSGNVEM